MAVISILNEKCPYKLNLDSNLNLPQSRPRSTLDHHLNKRIEFWVLEKNIFVCFLQYIGHGGHLDHVTRAI